MQSLRSATTFVFLVFVQINAQATTIPSTCGQLQPGRYPRMTSAYETHHWPWHAAIYHRVDNLVSEYECGGTVISPNVILTAAHCVSENDKPMAPSNVSVSLKRLNLVVEESSAQHFKVAEITLHPNYISSWFDNDIAIIRLKIAATFGNGVGPVCLWNASSLLEIIGRSGTVIGWGKTETGNVSTELRQADMPVVHHGKCIESNRLFFGNYLSERNFCAGWRNGTSVCNGDSGASMTFEVNGVYYIRGILSLIPAIEDQVTFETSCDSTQFALFTDVAKYLPWIEEVTKECEIETKCTKPLYTSDNHSVCGIHIFVSILEQKCKFIFTETANTNVTMLAVDVNLEAVPDLSDALNKFANIKALELSHNNIKVVDGTKLTEFKRIERLHLGSNQIAEFGSETFDDLKDLTELHINNNSLTEIDRDLFFELRQLKELRLQHNQLKILPADIFRNNAKLEDLSVHDNEITEILQCTFDELVELKWLWLQRNHLEILPENLFRNNKKLVEISIADNRIKKIHVELFCVLSELRKLWIHNNRLEFLPENIFRNNTLLEEIWANNNKIKRIESDFRHLSKLVKINLEENVCTDELWVVEGFFGWPKLAQMQQIIWNECICDIVVQCDRIYVSSDNYVVCEIRHVIKWGKKCKIIFTNVTNTNITRLAIQVELGAVPDLSDALNKFLNLKALELSHNNIKIVDRLDFTTFKRIEMLNLGSNQIIEFRSDTFDDLKNLTELHTNNNNLTEIHRNLFFELRELKDLRLHKNQLKILPADVFRNNAKLERLSFSSNNLTEIDRNLFFELRQLKELRLQHNQLKILPADIFRNNSKLENLSFHDNQITEIHQGTFDALVELKRLWLHRNHLEMLPENLFRNNKKLIEISIADNDIGRIDSDFQHLPKLVHLDLQENVCINELCDVRQFCGHHTLTQMQEMIWSQCKCNIEVQCDRIYEIFEYQACRINVHMKLYEEKCKIVFTEPSNTNPNVTWLSIQGEFDVLPDLSDALNKFENLKVLEATHAKLKVLVKATLIVFRDIEELYLNANEIHEVGADTFDDLKNLTQLSLNNNNLTEVHVDLFSELRELRKLYLDNNQLETLPQGLFQNNEKLEEIWAADNKIKIIKFDFGDLPKLYLIDLRRNECIDGTCIYRDASRTCKLIDEILKRCESN